MLEAFSTKDWPALCGLEGNGCFLPTTRAVGSSLYLGIIARGRTSQSRSSFGLAGFATFRLVLELLVVEEELFSGCEDEVGAAVNTLQNLVLEFHGELLPLARDSRAPGRGRLATTARTGLAFQPAMANSSAQVHLPGFGPPCKRTVLLIKLRREAMNFIYQ